MAFEKVDLPSGAWAELRDPDLVTERLRKPVRRIQLRLGFDADLQEVVRWQGRMEREFKAAQEAAGEDFDPDAFEPSELPPVRQDQMTDSQLDLLSDLTNAVAVALVEAWSYEAPVTADTIQDLPQRDYEALLEAVGKHRQALLPNFDVDPAPDSPTEPSGASDAPSAE